MHETAFTFDSLAPLLAVLAGIAVVALSIPAVNGLGSAAHARLERVRERGRELDRRAEERRRQS